MGLRKCAVGHVGAGDIPNLPSELSWGKKPPLMTWEGKKETALGSIFWLYVCQPLPPPHPSLHPHPLGLVCVCVWGGEAGLEEEFPAVLEGY